MAHCLCPIIQSLYLLLPPYRCPIVQLKLNLCSYWRLFTKLGYAYVSNFKSDTCQFINHKLVPVQSAPSKACRAYVKDWHAQTVLVQHLVNLRSKGFQPRVNSSTCSAISAETPFHLLHNYIA